jgi:hypothetical protein
MSKKRAFDDVDWIQLARDVIQGRLLVKNVMNLMIP